MSPEWPIAFFDDDYLKIYRTHFTPEQTRSEVDFIEHSLGLPKKGRVLDLACGLGRHAVGMAQRGYEVTGVDFNPHYLAAAAEAADNAGVRVRWMAGDMRSLRFDAEFDGVYSFFTSFGYYSDPENERVLENVGRALRKGGRFLLDMANRDRVLTHPQERAWIQLEDGSLRMEEASLDLRTSRVTSRIILIHPESGARVVKEFELRVYTCAELTALMSRHGLEVSAAWGGSDRAAYSTESRRLILLAERPSVRGQER